MSVHVRGQSSSFVRIHFHLQAVAFVRGGWPSFMGGQVRVRVRLGGSGSFLSVHVCSWAVLTLTRCGGGGPLVGGGGGYSSWQLCGGGVGWLVVVNEDNK